MKRLSKRWRIALWIFNFINIGGAIEAAVMREPMHAATHVALLLVTAMVYLRWRGSPVEEQREDPMIQQADQILDRLQQSVDSIAVEVERIGESQRFNAKLLDERERTPE